MSLSAKALSVTIHMIATEQFFSVVLFITLCMVTVTLSLWVKSLSVTIHMIAIRQFFRMVLFIILYTAIA